MDDINNKVIPTEGEMLIPPVIEDTEEVTEVEQDVNAETDGEVIESQEQQAQPFITFKTQEELDAYIAQNATNTVQDDTTQNEIQTNGKYVDPNWKPQTWDEAIQVILSKAKPEVVEAITKLQKEEAEEIKKKNEEIDKEYEELAKSNNLPPLTTIEGKQMDEQIAKVALRYKLDSYKDAYDILVKTGGIAPQKQDTRKTVSSIIGGTSAGASADVQKLDYKKLHATNLDDLIDQRMQNE